MSSPSLLPARCFEELAGRRITVRANGRAATFLNPDQERIKKIDVDCWLQPVTGLKSDFLLAKAETVDVIIELKGQDIDHALNQILATLEHWKTTKYCSPRFGGLVVFTRSPKRSATLDNLKLKLLTKHKIWIEMGKSEVQEYEFVLFTGNEAMNPLQDQLDEITANTRHLVQAERLAVGERAVEELFASGIEERILPVGAMAPEFALKDANGRLVRSSDLLAVGPLVIKFFRGRWCSYCVTELEAWRDLYGTLRERGALLVAIGPQIARQSDFMAGQHGLPFPVLNDPGCAVAEKFGLVYTVPEYHQHYYRSILVNIPFVNGEPSWRLPLPATYVIGRDGRVFFAEAHADFRVRPEPEEALAVALAAHGR